MSINFTHGVTECWRYAPDEWLPSPAPINVDIATFRTDRDTGMLQNLRCLEIAALEEYGLAGDIGPIVGGWEVSVERLE